MHPEQFRELVDRYLSGQGTPAELEQLKLLLEDPAYVQQLENIMDEQLAQSTLTANDFPQVVARIRESVQQKIRHDADATEVDNGKVRRLAWIRWAAAAAIILFVSVVAIRFINRNDSPSQLADNNPVKDSTIITPGKDGAILTLADGTVMILDSLANGVITTQSKSQVMLVDGKLVYKNPERQTGEVTYNTISTPKGRQFRIELEDGTKVWLNAASSLRYPVAFAGNERKVEITGEAYFEVARDEQRKFFVNAGNAMTVEVLGTHFNINSYDNESTIRTTLLEGSVRVTANQQEKLIKPGQQAFVTEGSDHRLRVDSKVNLGQVMAWKNGQFDFNNASLREVMRQLERWYDIEVEYGAGVKDYEFVGKMDRGLSLQEVLRGLAMSEVKFELTGNRKIIVKP